jgi:hypothetical protein
MNLGRRVITALAVMAIPLAGVAAATPSLAAHAPAAAASTPVVYNASSLVEPSSMCLGPVAGRYRCADSLTHLKWSSWGSSAAEATGTQTWFSSPCTVSTCGTGPATVRLSRIRFNGDAPYYGQVRSVWQQPLGITHKVTLKWNMLSRSWNWVSPVACYPVSNESTCYEPGEFCRDDDLGVTGLAGDGAVIFCKRYGRGDYPHWKRVSALSASAVPLVTSPAVLTASAVLAATASRIGSCTAEGDFATCDADGTADDPVDIYAHVASSPRQQVTVFWDMTCSKGDGAGSSQGQFTATTTVRRLIHHPYTRPDQCSVAAAAQLSDGGSLHVWLSDRR